MSEPRRKWKYALEDLDLDGPGEIQVYGYYAQVEALRAIAEELEGIKSELVVIASELINRNEKAKHDPLGPKARAERSNAEEPDPEPLERAAKLAPKIVVRDVS